MTRCALIQKGRGVKRCSYLKGAAVLVAAAMCRLKVPDIPKVVWREYGRLVPSTTPLAEGEIPTAGFLPVKHVILSDQSFWARMEEADA